MPGCAIVHEQRRLFVSDYALCNLHARLQLSRPLSSLSNQSIKSAAIPSFFIQPETPIHRHVVMATSQNLSIVGHRLVNGVVDHQLLDENTGQKSFEPAYVLYQSRVDLIQYRKKHRLTRYREHMAPPPDENPLDSNGVDTPTVLDLVSKYSRRVGCMNSGLVPEDYPGPSAAPRNMDHLYVHGHECHFYVYLFISSRYPRFSIVMDGENSCYDQPEMLEILRKATRRRLRPIMFADQYYRGHCGSSAIAICLA